MVWVANNADKSSGYGQQRLVNLFIEDVESNMIMRIQNSISLRLGYMVDLFHTFIGELYEIHVVQHMVISESRTDFAGRPMRE